MSKLVKGWRYTVIGCGQFPTDMMRYDECYPASDKDREMIERTMTMEGRRKLYKERKDNGEGYHYRVTLLGVSRPTTGRWSSFLFNVVAEELEPAMIDPEAHRKIRQEIEALAD